jgi:SAM-dependent methyltransferase
MIVNKSGTDAAWDGFGRDDPYFGVLSQSRFRAASKPGPERDEFFQSGVSHIERIFSLARDLVPDFAPRRALDFGCGVGRLVLPLARQVQEVVGIDVSPSMLAEAQRNSEQAGVTNATFFESDDTLSRVKGSFDFIHSFIVFQHIPVVRGLAIANELLSRLSQDGVGALHFTYARTAPTWRRVVSGITKWVPGAHMGSNILRGRPVREPPMQMNPYPLDRLFASLQAHGCHRVCTYFSDHEGTLGVLLVFQRRQLPGF